MSVSAPRLLETSEDVAVVEYLLQLQLDAPQLKVSDVYDISNAKTDTAFTNYVKKMKNANIVDVFVPLHKLQQPLSDIINSGIRVNAKTGFRFQTNGMPLNMTDEMHEVVHLAIAMGTIINNEIPDCPMDEVKYDDNPITDENLKYNIDTLRISEDNEFVVFAPQQIKTAHFVRFAGGRNITHDKPVFNQCYVCGKDNATIWCENDCIKLCEECDRETHSTSKVTAKHSRVPIDESNADFQVCPIHHGQRVQYYCAKCHAPVCLECKIHGTHAKGDCARHTLVPVAQAFNNQKEALENPSKIFEHRSRIIKVKIDQADARLRELADEEVDILNTIQRAAQQASEQAHKLFLERARAVKSAKTELQRKASEVAEMQKMIAIHRDCSEPLDLLQAAFASTILEAEVEKNADLPMPPENLGEIVLVGQLECVVNGGVSSPVLDRGVHIPQTDYITETATANTASYSRTETSYTQKQPHITSLAKMAKRKAEKHSRAGISLDFRPFEGSSILTDDVLAREVYMCLPFKATPQTKLMFSTEKDGRSMRILHRNVDGMGITVVLVRVGEHVFGGFAASKWNTDGVPFGQNTSTFLFSVDNDAFIPYTGASDEPIVLWADKESLTFGRSDLVLADNFDGCISELENNFGVGFRYDSIEAKTFLAGAKEFKADVVEVWGFFSGN